MIESGWQAEVAALTELGVPAAAKPFESIGYRELRALVEQEKSGGNAQEAIAQATRRYAKRQMTWFRKEHGVLWLPGFGDDPHVVAAAIAGVDRVAEEHRPGAAEPPAQGAEDG